MLRASMQSRLNEKVLDKVKSGYFDEIASNFLLVNNVGFYGTAIARGIGTQISADDENKCIAATLESSLFKHPCNGLSTAAGGMGCCSVVNWRCCARCVETESSVGSECLVSSFAIDTKIKECSSVCSNTVDLEGCHNGFKC